MIGMRAPYLCRLFRKESMEQVPGLDHIQCGPAVLPASTATSLPSTAR